MSKSKDKEFCDLSFPLLPPKSNNELRITLEKGILELQVTCDIIPQ